MASRHQGSKTRSGAPFGSDFADTGRAGRIASLHQYFRSVRAPGRPEGGVDGCCQGRADAASLTGFGVQLAELAAGLEAGELLVQEPQEELDPDRHRLGRREIVVRAIADQEPNVGTEQLEAALVLHHRLSVEFTKHAPMVGSSHE